MIDKKQLWTLAEETMRAFAPFYLEVMQKAIQDSGAPDYWFGLSLARGSDPQPFTVERYHAMFPYTAPDRFTEILEGLARLELLERVGEGAYRLSDLGRKAVENIFEAAHRGLDTIEPLPAGEMDQLNGLLYRLVEATLAAPEPEEKWAIAYSRWTDPGAGASGSVKADQYLTDLLRYRDDAHIAAWKPYDVSGHAWEALTFIWRCEANTAEELVEKLPFRAHSVEDYQAALENLVVRGWLVEEAGTYQLTERGRQIREEAEEATDRHFFVGWAALSEEELAQLQDLLTRTQDSLRASILSQSWDLARELSRAIPAAVREVVAPLVEERGLDKPGFFYTLLSAQRFDPDPISAARIGIRDPYTNLEQYDNLLNDLAEAGFLAPQEDGEYKFTAKGRTALQQVNHAFYTQLGEISPLPTEELAQLESLMSQIVAASLGAAEPESKWCIYASHRGHPSQEYAPLAQIDQHLDDLNAFRDDVHLAAWKPYDVSGHAWEILTFVWRGEASTAEELTEKLPFRNHTVEANTVALAHLASRGWVEETAEGYRVTEKGQVLRQQAEETTDCYFFAPWACLSTPEVIQLHDLLTRLRNSLQEIAPADTDVA